MNKNYILVNGRPEVEPDLMKWAKWFELPENRRIAYDRVDDCQVSTVFLGIDHNFSGEGLPVLYETMVFGGALADEGERYRTLGEAKTGHVKMVETVREACGQNEQETQ